MSDNNIRYEITHDGEIVEGTTALSSNMGGLINDLFSQYGWKCYEVEKKGTYRRERIVLKNNKSVDINLFAGNIRNEKRNSYEKKIQLSKSDPREYKAGITLILGFYVSHPDDDLKNTIVVGYPVDEEVNYSTNPSLRGVFVNDILIKAKKNGVHVDEVRRTVGFRPEYLLYYLRNYSFFHQYTDGKYSTEALVNFDDIEIESSYGDFNTPMHEEKVSESSDLELSRLIEFIRKQQIIDELELRMKFDVPTVSVALTMLEGKREVIKFDENRYINVSRLQSNGIGTNELTDYCDRCFSFSSEHEYFSAKTIEKENVCEEISDLGFGAPFYQSLLLSDTRFSRRLIDDVWFFSTSTDNIQFLDIIKQYVNQVEYITVDELIRDLYDIYGLNINRNTLLNRIKDSELYHDRVLDYIYKDYETYYNDI